MNDRTKGRQKERKNERQEQKQEKIKESKEQKHNITILRETKAALKAALKKAKDSDE